MPGTLDKQFTDPGVERDLLWALEEEDLAELAARVGDDVNAAGIKFGSGEDETPFALDPVPRVFTAEEWRLLEQGLAQRVRALNEFLVDAHTERRIERAGRIPPWLLGESAWLEPDTPAPLPGRPMAGIAGLDIVRGADGELLVLEDNLRNPSGAAYAVLAREIADRHLPGEPPPRRPVEPALAEYLRDVLEAAAPEACAEPSIALLSDGPENSAWWEHTWLAELLDIPVVTPADLRTESFDVIYRRTDEGRVRDERGELTWLAEALLEPVRDGRLGLVNGFGTGVGDDKLAHAYAEEMIRFYLGEEPLIRSVPTYDPGDEAVRDEVLERIDELVVKPRFGHGGKGVVVCAHASAEDREGAAQMIRENPRGVVVQETISLSTHPTIVEGRLEPRHIDLRAFVYCGRAGERVLPGGLTRMALDAGALVVNSSQNGGAKDTWVLEHRAAPPLPASDAPRSPSAPYVAPRNE
jgi:uncharacterized circularly permuted ATP-grasp superfamily protein